MGLLEPEAALRRQTLYPAELRAHGWELLQFKTNVQSIATCIAWHNYLWCLIHGPRFHVGMTFTRPWPL